MEKALFELPIFIYAQYVIENAAIRKTNNGNNKDDDSLQNKKNITKIKIFETTIVAVGCLVCLAYHLFGGNMKPIAQTILTFGNSILWKELLEARKLRMSTEMMIHHVVFLAVFHYGLIQNTHIIHMIFMALADGNTVFFNTRRLLKLQGKTQMDSIYRMNLGAIGISWIVLRFLPHLFVLYIFVFHDKRCETDMIFRLVAWFGTGIVLMLDVDLLNRVYMAEKSAFSSLKATALNFTPLSGGLVQSASLTKPPTPKKVTATFQALLRKPELSPTKVSNLDRLEIAELAMAQTTKEQQRIKFVFSYLKNKPASTQLFQGDNVPQDLLDAKVVHQLRFLFPLEYEVFCGHEQLAVDVALAGKSLLIATGFFMEDYSKRMSEFTAFLDAFSDLHHVTRSGVMALKRLNSIHGSYAIPNEAFKFTLGNRIFGFLRTVDKLGWRDLTDSEKDAWFRHWKRIGERMGISGLPDSRVEYQQWYNDLFDKHMVANEKLKEKKNLFSTFGPQGSNYVLSAWAEDRLYRQKRFIRETGCAMVLHTLPHRLQQLMAGERSKAVNEDADGTLYMFANKQTIDTWKAHSKKVAESRMQKLFPWAPSIKTTPALKGAASTNECGMKQAWSKVGPDGASKLIPMGQRNASSCPFLASKKQQVPSTAVQPDKPIVWPVQQSSQDDILNLANEEILKVYSWNEIKSCRDRDEWLTVIHGKVYDLKGLRKAHPGGEAILWRSVGRDSSKMFDASRHTEQALVMVLNYLVGRLDPTSMEVQDDENNKNRATINTEESNERTVAEWESLLLSIAKKVPSISSNVDTKVDLQDAGMSSVDAIVFASEVRKVVGDNYPILQMLATHPSIADLANSLGSGVGDENDRILNGASAESSVYPTNVMQLNKSKNPKNTLWCVHPVGGEVMFYIPIAKKLSESCRVLGIRAPEFVQKVNSDEPWLDDINKRARMYAKTVHETQKTGPIYIFGFSQGGAIATAMAGYLKHEFNRLVKNIVMIDTFGPSNNNNNNNELSQDQLQEAAITIAKSIGVLGNESIDDDEYRTNMVVRSLLAQRTFQLTGPSMDDKTKTFLFPASDNSRIVLPVASDIISSNDLGWSNHISNLVVKDKLPGDHTTVMTLGHKQITSFLKELVAGE